MKSLSRLLENRNSILYNKGKVSNNYNKEDKDLATIKDIANRLGVSVSTVSKGLNGASDISDELRQMVLDTAVEMGYATKRSKDRKSVV